MARNWEARAPTPVLCHRTQRTLVQYRSLRTGPFWRHGDLVLPTYELERTAETGPEAMLWQREIDLDAVEAILRPDQLFYFSGRDHMSE